ncbi:DUF7504 family protein [Halosimplex amylolyticum]|uniref:DUF7504 family protein n=1 Tax=Halosimplex amylolyticum TaxID=3396616 RepID=UPI003F57218D
MCPITAQVGVDLEPGDSVLVRCPQFAGNESRICIDLQTPAAPQEVNALAVLFTQSPSDHLGAWQRHAGSYPARSHIVSVDADARSSSEITDEAAEENRTVTRVNSPGNLTRLGIRITDCLEEWGESSDDQQIVGCFHSISTLLQYVDLDQAFRFLRVVTDRFEDVDAISHYHLNPQTHDEQTVATLTELFDTVLEYDGDDWGAHYSN